MIRKKFTAAVLAMLGTLLMPGCSPAAPGGGGTSQTAVHHTISPKDARDMMAASQDYILLDVRTDQEFQAGHIPGAVLLPDFEIEEMAEEMLPDKDARIYVYCRSGRRSAGAAKKLAEMGYTGVYDFGGILDWPYETTSGN